MKGRRSVWLLASVPLLLTGWSEAVVEGSAPEFEPIRIALCGEPAPPASASICGFSLVARGDGPQVALMHPARTLVASLRRDEDVDAVVDLLRRAGVGLRGLQGTKNSLEDVFLDALGGAGKETDG